MTQIHQFLSSTTFRAAQQFGGLGVVSLVGTRGATEVKYVLLGDALRTGRFEITEITDSGVVSRLRATNRTGASSYGPGLLLSRLPMSGG